MKFTCSQVTLTRALNTVSKAVSNKTTIPVLRGILIQAKDNKLTLTSSDLDISIIREMPAEIEEEGSSVVPSKLFGDIVRKLPNEEIVIEDTAAGSLNMSTSSSDFSVVTMPVDQFPKIGDSIEDKAVVRIEANMFREMIRKTSFAASMEEAKGTLVGILTELTPDTIEMVALDGFRLAHTSKEMINEESRSFIVAAKIMNELSKITSDEIEAATVRISLGDKSAVVNVGSTEIILRIMEGEFIRYRDIIPKDSQIKVVISRSLLLESIERASLLAKEGKNNLIKFSIRDSMITITSRSEEGNVKEEIGIDKEGDDLDIGFNSKYVIDVLKAIDDEEIMMNFKNSISPCVISPVEGREFEYLVLPVRIPNI